MKFEHIAQIILIFSFLGMAVLVFRKIPILIESPDIPAKREPGANFLKGLKEKIKNSKYFKADFFEILLQKIISKTRILSLKTENKTADWLKRLRERSQEKKIKKEDNFWEELKKSTNEDKK